MRYWHWIAMWPTLAVLVVATVTDLRSRRIPNWLVLPFLLLGIMISPFRTDWSGIGQGFWARNDWAGFRHDSWHGLGQSLAGLGLGLFLYGILFLKFGMGAGDVKLGAAIGAWVGPMQLFWALFLTAMAGGMMVLCWIAYCKLFKRAILGAGDLLFGRQRQGVAREAEASLADLLRRNMPYAPAIALGTITSFFVL